MLGRKEKKKGGDQISVRQKLEKRGQGKEGKDTLQSRSAAKSDARPRLERERHRTRPIRIEKSVKKKKGDANNAKGKKLKTPSPVKTAPTPGQAHQQAKKKKW